ncbi:MAG: TIM barrel protein [Deinococcales bacterium]
MKLKLANAPCSWGTIEGWGQSIDYAQMLDELVATGYVGTELGDYGFMPTDPQQLRQALSSRNLTMLGAYEGVYFRDEREHAPGLENILRNARLLKSVADLGDPNTQPFVVIADEHSRDAPRFANAGRITKELSLSNSDWQTFAKGVNNAAKAVHDETGLRSVFHHHCGGYVEAPHEIDELLARTDSSYLGLVFDTGHFLYGSGTNNGELVLQALENFATRLWYVHFKDCSPDVADMARAKGYNYKEAIGAGVFCELGRGRVDFAAVTKKLEQIGYDGWICVEQDVLPGMGEPKVSAARNRQHLAKVAGL